MEGPDMKDFSGLESDQIYADAQYDQIEAARDRIMDDPVLVGPSGKLIRKWTGRTYDNTNHRDLGVRENAIDVQPKPSVELRCPKQHLIIRVTIDFDHNWRPFPAVDYDDIEKLPLRVLPDSIFVQIGDMSDHFENYGNGFDTIRTRLRCPECRYSGIWTTAKAIDLIADAIRQERKFVLMRA
jgi:hypothetical protein